MHTHPDKSQIQNRIIIYVIIKPKSQSSNNGFPSDGVRGKQHVPHSPWSFSALRVEKKHR